MAVNFVYVTLCFTAVIATAIATQSDGCAQKSLMDISLPADDDLPTLVRKFFDKVVIVIQNNDPFTIDNKDLNYNSYGVLSKGYLRDVLISYFSSAELKNLNVQENPSSLEFGFDLYLEKVQFVGKYDIYFSFLTMLPVYGAGKFGILMSGFNMSVKTSFKQTDDKVLQLTQVNLATTVNSTMASTENLFNNESLGVYLGHVISSVLADIVNENQNGASLLNMALRALLNSLLCSSAITLDTIITVMKGFIG